MNARALLLLPIVLWACVASAQPQRLDDSASPSGRVPAVVALDETGRPLDASPHAERAQLRFGRIEYRLATAAYVGKQVRISYVVPAMVPGLRSPQALRVEWRGQPPLASGSGRPGDRVPVWTGRVSEPWTQVALDLTAWVELRELTLRGSEPFGFECYFDIEVIR